MGRTIPPFRIASAMEEGGWKQFRNSVDKLDRKAFDRMFSLAHLYNSASSYAAKPVRIQPIFLSIIFHHYKSHFTSRALAIRWKPYDTNLLTCNDLSIAGWSHYVGASGASMAVISGRVVATEEIVGISTQSLQLIPKLP